MIMKQQERIAYIDVAKGIGIFLIVLAHVLKNGYIRQYIYSFHVPLFFLLSGVTYNCKKDKKEYWKRIITRNYVPYIVFSIVSILVFFVFGQIVAGKMNIEIIDGTLWDNIWGMIYGNSRNGLMKWNTPLWFLPCLLVVYLIADCFEMTFQKFGGGRIILMLFSLVFTWFVATRFRDLKLPFGIETAVFMVSFFELGIIIRENDYVNMICKLVNNRVQLLFLALVFLALVIPLCYINGMAQVRIMILGKNIGLFLMSSLCGIIGVVLLSVFFQESNAMVYLGRNTMPILLMHKFPVLFFQSIMPGTKLLLKNGDTLSGLLCAVVVSAVSIRLCLVAGNVIANICPAIIGKKRRLL